MKRLIAKLLSVVLVLAFLLSASGIPVIAQTDEPPQTPEIAQTDEPPLPPEAPRPHAREVDPGLLPVAGAQYDPNSGWFVEADPLGPEMSPQATELSGGPDSYGYTWTDLASASWTWVDATTGGTLTPLTYNMDEVTVSLPFSFKYYENVYSEVNLSAYGYMGFGYDYLYDSSPQSPIRPLLIMWWRRFGHSLTWRTAAAQTAFIPKPAAKARTAGLPWNGTR